MVWMEQAKRRTWLSRSLLLVIPCCALFAALSSCAEPRIIGTAAAPEDGGTFSPLAPIDASASDADSELIAYCPSNKCPPGWTTCPSSRFPCDVNLLADPNNCGACGNACPVGTIETFSCVEGACGMACPEGTFDCDGLPDNGCEERSWSNLNCGACGNECPDDKPCLKQDAFGKKVGCGCPPGKVDCGGICKDLTANDSSCGACDNACDSTGGPGAPQYPNMVYGCSASTCGHPKCKPYFQDCDSENENGCETSLVTDESCGGCGSACPAGQHCYLNGHREPECMCAGDLTLCLTGTYEGHPEAQCVDLSSDLDNCGACGAICDAAAVSVVWMSRTCDYGICVSRCKQDHADCNGNEADGCEIDTRSDPRNCGGCGIVCDAVAGQACVAGKCVVEPCDQLDAGEATR